MRQTAVRNLVKRPSAIRQTAVVPSSVKPRVLITKPPAPYEMGISCLFPQHHHRKPIGFLGCKLVDATETDGLHLRFLDAIVDELLGDVTGTGNAQCAVTLGGAGGFVGSPRDVDGQVVFLGILGDLCEVCQLRLGDQLGGVQLEIEIDRDTDGQLEGVVTCAVIGGCGGCHTTAERIQTGIVVFVGRQCATVLLPVDILLV